MVIKSLYDEATCALLVNGNAVDFFCTTRVSIISSIIGPPMLLHIGGPFQSLCLSSVCLPRCVLWPNGPRYAYSVHRSRI